MRGREREKGGREGGRARRKGEREEQREGGNTAMKNGSDINPGH